jgi:ferredoxin-NADP reductase
VAGTAVLGRLTWRLGEVVSLVDETPSVRSIVLDVPGWPGHRPGQHLDVRLTAEDGYRAERSYSIANAPEGARVVLTVERLDDGEVSPYLVDELRPGDELELRGPVGGYFVWDGRDGPLLLVGGGSGVVPLASIARHRAALRSEVPARLLLSSRTLADVIYRSELDSLASSSGVEIVHTLTREQPPGWTGHRGRVDRPLLEQVAWPVAERPLVFVCGPTGFVEAVAEALVGLGHDPARIRTERFGATGGTG